MEFLTKTTIAQLPGSTTGSSYGSVSWDSADNVYSVSSGVSILRAYSLGLSTVTVSSNDFTGINGSFSFRLSNLPGISVQATTNLASENYGSPIYGAFTLTRGGSASDALSVNYTLTGTATNGVDYTLGSANSVTFLSRLQHRHGVGDQHRVHKRLSPESHREPHFNQRQLLCAVPACLSNDQSSERRAARTDSFRRAGSDDVSGHFQRLCELHRQPAGAIRTPARGLFRRRLSILAGLRCSGRITQAARNR